MKRITALMLGTALAAASVLRRSEPYPFAPAPAKTNGKKHKKHTKKTTGAPTSTTNATHAPVK